MWKKLLNNIKCAFVHKHSRQFNMKSSQSASFIAIVSLCFTLGFTRIWSMAGTINGKKIICYTATYATARPDRGAFYLKNLNPALCTHVIFGYAHLKSDTTVYVLDSWKDFMNGTENVTELKKRYPSVKFMVALGGWYDRTDKFSRIAAKDDLRKSLAVNAIKFLKQYNFDGLDLCWLYPSKRDGSPYDRIGFVQLLKEFKNQFEPYNYTLSALLSASYDTIDTGYDVKEISETVDFMNMNTYDFNGFWSDDIQPNAPLYSNDRWNVDYAISYMMKLGADPQKLILGIPLYGRVFHSANSTLLKDHLMLGDTFDPTEETRKTYLGPYTQDASGVFGYGEICLELLKSYTWTRFWDENTKTPFITHEDKLITYDDRESVAFKVKYAVNMKLGGVAASSLDLDDFRGDCSNGSLNVEGFKDYLLLRSIRKDLEEIEEDNLDDGAISNVALSNHNLDLLISHVTLFLLFY